MTPRSSSTARAATAPRSRRRPSSSSGTPTWSRCPAASAAGRTRAGRGSRPRSSTPSSATATAAISCSPKSVRRASRSCSSRKVLLLGAGGLGSPAALVSRGRGSRDARDRRHGRRGRVEPPASDPPQHGARRRPQGRLGEEDADRAQPRRRRRHLRRAFRRRQHPRHHRRLRRHRRRHRQLPDSLPAERRRRS